MHLKVLGAMLCVALVLEPAAAARSLLQIPIPILPLLQTAAPGTVFTSDTSSPGGNPGGVYFMDDSSGGPITEVRMCYGDRMDSLEVIYGSVSGGVHGVPECSPSLTGGGLSSRTFTLEPNEVIVSARGRSGNSLDQLIFTTSTGREFQGGGGRFTGQEWTAAPPAGSNAYLYKISGRQGSRSLEFVTFHWRVPGNGSTPDSNASDADDFFTSNTNTGGTYQGDAFTDDTGGERITEVRVRSSQFVESVEFLYGNVSLGVHGLQNDNLAAAGSTYSVLVLEPDEVIVSARGYASDSVDALYFMTNMSREVGGGAPRVRDIGGGGPRGLEVSSSWTAPLAGSKGYLHRISGVASLDSVKFLTFYWRKFDAA